MTTTLFISSSRSVLICNFELQTSNDFVKLMALLWSSVFRVVDDDLS